MGPTEDGGYYLVGAWRCTRASSSWRRSAPATRAMRCVGNARALGLSVAFTEAFYDVDVPADLRRLAAELRIEPARAPRTAALLASWRPGLDARDDELSG